MVLLKFLFVRVHTVVHISYYHARVLYSSKDLPLFIFFQVSWRLVWILFESCSDAAWRSEMYIRAGWPRGVKWAADLSPSSAPPAPACGNYLLLGIKTMQIISLHCAASHLLSQTQIAYKAADVLKCSALMLGGGGEEVNILVERKAAICRIRRQRSATHYRLAMSSEQ